MSPLRRIALSTTVLAAAAIAATVPTALAAMHPQLAARLSGMGEHGIVNLTVNAKGKKVCWTFDVPTKGITGAAIHTARAAPFSSGSAARIRRRAARPPAR